MSFYFLSELKLFQFLLAQMQNVFAEIQLTSSQFSSLLTCIAGRGRGGGDCIHSMFFTTEVSPDPDTALILYLYKS